MCHCQGRLCRPPGAMGMGIADEDVECYRIYLQYSLAACHSGGTPETTLKNSLGFADKNHLLPLDSASNKGRQVNTQAETHPFKSLHKPACSPSNPWHINISVCANGASYIHWLSLRHDYQGPEAPPRKLTYSEPTQEFFSLQCPLNLYPRASQGPFGRG